MVKPYGHDKTMRSMIALLCEYNKVKDCQKTSIQPLCCQHGYRIDTILPPPYSYGGCMLMRYACLPSAWF